MKLYTSKYFLWRIKLFIFEGRRAELACQNELSIVRAVDTSTSFRVIKHG
jgi:hypothetical protein